MKHCQSIVKRAHKLLRHARENHIPLLLHPLSAKALYIVGLSDSSFTNNAYHNTQLGYILLLRHEQDNATPLHFKSYKTHHITHFVLPDEFIAFADMLDTDHTLPVEPRNLHPNIRITLRLFTGRKSLFHGMS